MTAPEVMAEANCACKQSKRLEGAGVPAYISAFLDPVDDSTSHEPRYRCRVCGREWQKHLPDRENNSKRVFLVRLD